MSKLIVNWLKTNQLYILAASGQLVHVSSPSVSGIKTEKTKVGPASSITIRRPQQIEVGSPPSTSGVKMVRVLNSGGSPQKVIQIQKTQQPRILNQTFGSSEVKVEPSTSRTVVMRKSEGDEPPTKKTKYITLTTSQINQIEGATILGGGKSKRIVMLPSNYREQLDKISTSPPASVSGQSFKIVHEIRKDGDIDPLNDDKIYPSGKKSKRPCNCTKSQCLKFYCDCFAAGEFCSGCNCKDCSNENESEEREKAIKLCMERNPFAFR